MIAIIDYGVGNLFSLSHSVQAVGGEAVVTGDAGTILRADHVLLPGVGAFGDAAEKLRQTGLDAVVKDVAARGTPVMGICLGMQLLFDKSYEFGEHAGLGLIPGEVRPIAEVIPAGLKIPHIGWNALIDVRPHPVFRGIKPGDCVYFVHSYYGAKCADYILANAEYGAPLTAAVGNGNVVGCQFHPEKSGDVGLSILKAFIQWNGFAVPSQPRIPAILRLQGRSEPELIHAGEEFRLFNWHDNNIQFLFEFVNCFPEDSFCELIEAIKLVREGKLKHYGVAIDHLGIYFDDYYAKIDEQLPGYPEHTEYYTLDDLEIMVNLYVRKHKELYGVDLAEVGDEYIPLAEGILEESDYAKSLRRFPKEDT